MENHGSLYLYLYPPCEPRLPRLASVGSPRTVYLSIGAGSVLHAIRWTISADRDPEQWLQNCRYSKERRDTVTMMTYGFDPYLSSLGQSDITRASAVYAVLGVCWPESWQPAAITSKIRFTFQEYFRRMTRLILNVRSLAVCSTPWCIRVHSSDSDCRPSEERTVHVRITVNDIDVPPTLVSFAVDVASYRTGCHHTGVQESRQQDSY